jgi:hypothetical protein
MANDKVTIKLREAVSEVTTEIEILKEDLQISVDNMEEKFSGTERYQKYEDALQQLEIWEEPEVLQMVADKEVKYEIKRNPTKKTRRLENIRTMLGAIHEVLSDEEYGDNDELEGLIHTVGEMYDEVEAMEL